MLLFTKEKFVFLLYVIFAGIFLLFHSDVEAEPNESETTILFDGELSDQWLGLSAAGGDFKKFAKIQDKTLLVNVPEGNSWGKTGLRSAQMLFKIPNESENTAIKLSFVVEPENSTDFVYAIIPSNWDGNLEWRSHLIRLQANKNKDDTYTLSLMIQKQELMKTSVDISQIKQLNIIIRSDKIVMVTDINNTILLQALMNKYASIYPEGYKISVLTHAKESNLQAKLVLKTIKMQVIKYNKEVDPTVISNQLGAAILFDGHLMGHLWKPYLKGKVEFDKVAKLKNGSLEVSVPIDKDYANIGIQSTQPIIWLDEFGNASKREIIFDFIPEKTTGFAIVLANNGENFTVKWFKNTKTNKAVIQIYISNSLTLIDNWNSKFTPLFEKELDAIAPEQIKFTISPQGIHLSGDKVPEHLQEWKNITANSGYDIYVYSFPELPNKPVKMALKKITLDNLKLVPIKSKQGNESVKPLPIKEFLNKQNTINWDITRWESSENSTFSCEFTDAGFTVKDLEKDSPISECSINHKDQIINLDERIEIADFKLTAQFKPKETKNFRIIWSSQSNRRNWDFCELSLSQTENNTNKLNLNCSGILQKTVSSDWLESQWDGKVNIIYGDKFIQAELNNGKALRLNAGSYKHMYLYVMAHDYRHKTTNAEFQVTEITGQWQPHHKIKSVERWQYIDKEDFDPAAFIQDLANDLPHPNASILEGEDNEK